MATKSTLSGPAADYLKFLRDAQKARSLASAPGIDANEEALLNALALAWVGGKPLAVRAAMGLSQLGSPSTLHRRISRLKALGLIEDASSPDSLRIKLLVPSNRALSYFGRLGKAVAG